MEFLGVISSNKEKEYNMNTLELTKKLFEMAENQTKYEINWCIGIINAIINNYMVTADYMEEDAINTMQGFLESGVLVW